MYLADECIYWELVFYSTKGGMYMYHLIKLDESNDTAVFPYYEYTKFSAVTAKE